MTNIITSASYRKATTSQWVKIMQEWLHQHQVHSASLTWFTPASDFTRDLPEQHSYFCRSSPEQDLNLSALPQCLSALPFIIFLLSYWLTHYSGENQIKPYRCYVPKQLIFIYIYICSHSVMILLSLQGGIFPLLQTFHIPLNCHCFLSTPWGNSHYLFLWLTPGMFSPSLLSSFAFSV